MSQNIKSGQVPHSIDPSTVVRGTFSPHEHPLLGPVKSASSWLGVTFSEYGKNYARAHMTIRPEMLNGFRIAHGGMVFAFADTCFAWACNDFDGDGSTMTVAQGADINFLSSPIEGMVLTAVGVKYERTGRSGICDVTVLDDRDRVVAEFRGRFRTIETNRSK